jgi:membrane associated rhomboid family serine protease
VFASILFSPTSTLLVFFIPMPAILYGILFLVYSAYSARRGGDHIGHLAHFTGAIFGFVFPLLLQPSLLLYFVHQLVG